MTSDLDLTFNASMHAKTTWHVFCYVSGIYTTAIALDSSWVHATPATLNTQHFSLYETAQGSCVPECAPGTWRRFFLFQVWLIATGWRVQSRRLH